MRRIVEVVELDTSHFVATRPAGHARLRRRDLVARTALQPDTRHRFACRGPVAEQVRLDVYPDGGMARLRVSGVPTAEARAALADRFLRLLPVRSFLRCCAGRSALRRRRNRLASATGVADLPASARAGFRLSSLNSEK